MADQAPPARFGSRVVVVGGGFGGLWATRGLRHSPVQVTLVDQHNHHLFQPLLYQVATAGLAAPSVAAPLRYILRGQRNVTVLLGRVGRVDVEGRCIIVDGHPLAYDQLVLAPGATHSYFGRDDWAADAPGLKTLDDALRIRARVLSAFERAEATDDPAERDALLTFVVVGGGPTGVELAGTLAEIARHTLRDEFRRIDPARSCVLLLEAGPRVLPAFTPELSADAQRRLERLGVTVRTGAAVTSIVPGAVEAGGMRIASATVLWAAGVAASPLGADLGVPRDRAGRVLVEPDLTVPGHPEIFVIGDLATVRSAGRPVPGVAPAAKQMGRHVARTIAARAAGRPTTAFLYRDQGALATIGRRAAVVQFGRLKLRGLLAWWFWLAAHVYFLVGFRNRLVVLIDWAWAYWTYQRSARIIVGRGSDPPGGAVSGG
jgi:NADH:ubiquinone reductase (H+-translocating)